MKNILVPTDFSACAGNALDAAVKFAEKFDAVVHLLHLAPLPVDWQERSGSEQAADPESRQLIANTEVLLREIADAYPNLSMQTTVRGGKLADAITATVNEKGIDLVIMGSHGASGKSEYFIGSNTQKVVRSVHCPVLVVKHKLENIEFDRVVFASNFNESERDAFLRFKEFVKPFIPEIHLVMVHTSSLFDPPYTLSQEAMEEFKTLCHPFKCEIHIFRDFTIEKGIRSFSEEIGATLIGISNHNRHPIKRMLIGSNVEALVNHSNLPILSVDYRK